MTTSIVVKVVGDFRTRVKVTNTEDELREERVIDGDICNPEGETFYLNSVVPPSGVFTITEVELTQEMKDARGGDARAIPVPPDVVVDPPPEPEV